MVHFPTSILLGADSLLLHKVILTNNNNDEEVGKKHVEINSERIEIPIEPVGGEKVRRKKNAIGDPETMVVTEAQRSMALELNGASSGVTG